MKVLFVGTQRLGLQTYVETHTCFWNSGERKGMFWNKNNVDSAVKIVELSHTQDL